MSCFPVYPIHLVDLCVQGYVTEIILTLEAVVDNIDLQIQPIDYMRDIFMSTPNLAQSPGDGRRGGLMAPKQQQPHAQQHMRSVSYAVQGVAGKQAGCTYSGYAVVNVF